MQALLAIAAVLALVAVAVLGGLRATRARGWQALEATHVAVRVPEGKGVRLPWCWIGSRAMPYRNCVRAHFHEDAVTLAGIGPFGWFHRPLRLPLGAVTAYAPAPLGGHDDLLLQVDGLEVGLSVPLTVRPWLATRGIAPADTR